MILNFRSTEDTLRAVAAVRRSTTSVQRLIVVDNCAATDPEHTELLRKLGPEVTCLASGGNLGYAGGNNVGIRVALAEGSDFVWLLNPDTEVEADCLGRLLATAADLPDAGTLGPRILFSDGRIQSDGGVLEEAAFGAPSSLHNGRVARDVPETLPSEVDYVSGAAILIRRSVLDSVGLLPEEYFLYFEEAAFCRDVRAAGWRNIVDARARVVHHRRSIPGLPTPTYMYYMTRNRLYFAQRYFDASPDAVLPSWEQNVLRSWRRRVEHEQPDFLPVFDALVERAVADARAGVLGPAANLPSFPRAPAVPPVGPSARAHPPAARLLRAFGNPRRTIRGLMRRVARH